MLFKNCVRRKQTHSSADRNLKCVNKRSLSIAISHSVLCEGQHQSAV